MRTVLLLVTMVFLFQATPAWSRESSPVPPEPAPEGEARLLRYPDIHGDRVVFMASGDLWTVPLSGGRAVRLTTGDGLELSPRFSPDGRWIAFTGEYDGNRDVYVIPAGGGSPRRLTMRQASYGELRHGYDNHVLGWTPDGSKVLFRSWRRSFDMWFEKLFLARVDGSGPPEEIELPEAGLADYSPDGGRLAYNRIFRNFRTWKRYRGGLAQDIWIWDFEAGRSRRLTDWEGTDTEPAWVGEHVYFSSDRSGKLNVYRADPATGEQEQLTFHGKWDVRWMSGGPGGLVYQCGGYLYHLDTSTGAERRIPVSLGDDLVYSRGGWEDASSAVRVYNLSATGKRAVFEARGDIWTVPAEHGEVRRLTATSGVHEREPVWSPDGKWIAMISDESGEEELYLLEPGPVKAGGREKVRLTTGGNRHIFDPVWSPDSRKIAFSDKNLRLWLADVAGKTVTLVDTSALWEMHNFSFSPCSRWLAYSKPVQRDREFYSVFLYDIDGKSVHRVSSEMTNDYDPVFGPEGKYLYFISGRDLKPRLGRFEMSYLYENTDRIYLLTLQADTLSPLAPRSDEEEAAAKPEDDEEQESNGDNGEKPKTHIDLEGLGERTVVLGDTPGDYRYLKAAEGRVYWLSAGDEGTHSLVVYDLGERKETTIAEGIAGYDISPDRKKLIVRKGAGYFIADAGSAPLELSGGALDLSGMRAKVDYTAEWRQMFEEAWRQERDFFYDPELHGVDWAAVRERYSPLVDHARHRDDLNYILGEMVAELACSHTYVGGGDYPEVGRVRSALLGAELERHNGLWRIGRILPGENWTDDTRSPLTMPGADVSEGDYLLAVDGEPLDAAMNPYGLLEGKAGRTIRLTVGPTTDPDDAATVDIRPITEEQPLRYQAWVEQNRRKVSEATGGRVGYLHIPDMGYDGLNEFVKRFYPQIGKQGLVIDVRYNGGGFVSQMILERLRRELVGMDAPRNAAAETYPRATFAGPMVCLINQYSASDGDIFPYFFRKYGLGPLVGKRTWGGVIGIRGYSMLIDGGYVTRPEFGTFDADGNWIIENEGVSPDYEVDNLPEDVIAGRDPQLEKAVELILQRIESEPGRVPGKPAPPEPR